MSSHLPNFGSMGTFEGIAEKQNVLREKNGGRRGSSVSCCQEFYCVLWAVQHGCRRKISVSNSIWAIPWYVFLESLSDLGCCVMCIPCRRRFFVAVSLFGIIFWFGLFCCVLVPCTLVFHLLYLRNICFVSSVAKCVSTQFVSRG